MKKVICFLLTLALMITSVPCFNVALADSRFVTPYEQEYIDGFGMTVDEYFEFHDYLFNCLLDLRTDIEGFAGMCDVTNYNIPYSNTTYNLITRMVFYDDPKAFFVETVAVNYDDATNCVTLLYFKAYDAYTVTEIQSYLEQCEAVAHTFVDDIADKNLTDAQKAVLLHDRLALYTDYDSQYAYTDNTPLNDFSIVNTLLNRIAVCQGYVNTYIYLLRMLGVKCEYCYSNALKHGWAIVYIGQKPYYVDVTWDDGSTYGEVKHNYCLCSYSAFKPGHNANDYVRYPDDYTFDNYFWKNSKTTAVYYYGKMYFADNSGRKIVSWDGSNITDVVDFFPGSNGNVTRLACSDCLYYSLDGHIYYLEPYSGLHDLAFYLEGYTIYGFEIRGDYFYLDLRDQSQSSTKMVYNYIEEKQVTGVRLKTQPTRTEYYIGDVFNTSGISLTVYYSNGTNEVITSGYTYSGFDTITAGTKTVVLTYCDKSVSFNVNVLVKELKFDFEEIEDGKVAVTGYTGNGGYVYVPSELEGMTVTKIGDSAFYGNTKIKGLIIPNTVTHIGNSAFKNCSNLAYADIPDTVRRIEEYAFATSGIYNNANNWDSGVLYVGNHLILADDKKAGVYTVYDGTTCIADYAFANSKVTHVTFPDSVRHLGYDTFCNCVTLQTVTLGAGIDTIEIYEFYRCEALTDIYIPDGVKYINKFAFYMCSSLTTVRIPNSLEIIGEGAFAHCTAMQGVELPEGLTTIEKTAFYNCDSITTAIIPDTVTAMGAQTFYDCDSLATVTVGSGISVIEGHSFQNCLGLTDLTIKNGPETIEEYAFADSANIAAAEIPPSVKTIGKYAFLRCTGMNTLTLNEGLESIGEYCFYQNNHIQSITIPSTVRNIGRYAFCECTAAKSIVIEKGITKIGEAAFAYCSAVTKIKFPTSVNSLDLSCFNGCTRLQLAVIPESVTTINMQVFSGCRNLKIMGYANTAAQTYATRYNVPFVLMNYGKLSGGEEITAVDSLVALQASIGTIILEPDQQVLADVDGSEIVTAVDSMLILKYSIGQITIFPVEKI